MRRSPTEWLLAVYCVLVSVALVLAAVRLSASMDMPGLAAIELVLLALPWSLALGIEPMSHLGFIGMAAIVITGLALNGVILRSIASWLQRRRVPYDAPGPV